MMKSFKIANAVVILLLLITIIASPTHAEGTTDLGTWKETTKLPTNLSEAKTLTYKDTIYNIGDQYRGCDGIENGCSTGIVMFNKIYANGKLSKKWGKIQKLPFTPNDNIYIEATSIKGNEMHMLYANIKGHLGKQSTLNYAIIKLDVAGGVITSKNYDITGLFSPLNITRSNFAFNGKAIYLILNNSQKTRIFSTITTPKDLKEVSNLDALSNNIVTYKNTLYILTYTLTGTNAPHIFYMTTDQNGNIGTINKTIDLPFTFLNYETIPMIVNNNKIYALKDSSPFASYMGVITESGINNWKTTTALPNGDANSIAISSFGSYLYAIESTGNVFYTIMN